MGREKGQSRETGNIGYTRRRTKTHKTKNTSLYTNYVNKIWTLLHTTRRKHEPNIIYAEIVITINIRYKWA
jgi:hypothetical protein